MYRFSDIIYINSIDFMDIKVETVDLQPEDSSLRGYYTMLNGKQIPMFWRITVPSPPWPSNPLTLWLNVRKFFTFITSYTHSDTIFQTSWLILSWSVYSVHLLQVNSQNKPKKWVQSSSLLSVSLSIRLPADPPAHIEQLGPNWTDFPEIYTGNFLLQAVKINEVWLQSDKITGTFHDNLPTFMTALVTTIDFSGYQVYLCCEYHCCSCYQP
jgi:hypothetical protein